MATTKKYQNGGTTATQPPAPSATGFEKRQAKKIAKAKTRAAVAGIEGEGTVSQKRDNRAKRASSVIGTARAKTPKRLSTSTSSSTSTTDNRNSGNTTNTTNSGSSSGSTSGASGGQGGTGGSSGSSSGVDNSRKSSTSVEQTQNNTRTNNNTSNTNVRQSQNNSRNSSKTINQSQDNSKNKGQTILNDNSRKSSVNQKSSVKQKSTTKVKMQKGGATLKKSMYGTAMKPMKKGGAKKSC